MFPRSKSTTVSLTSNHFGPVGSAPLSPSICLTGTGFCVWQDVLHLKEYFHYDYSKGHFFIGRVIFSETLFSWTPQESMRVRYIMNYFLE